MAELTELVVANLEKQEMSSDQVQKLENVLLHAHDVFALDELELHCTSLVTHSINT